MDALSPEPVKSERCVSGCGRKKPLRRKTNANEKTTKSDMRDAPGVSLFPNAPMPGHKSSEEEVRVGNGLGLCTHGAVERLPLLN